MSAETFGRRLIKENVLLLVIAMLLVVPLLEPFTAGVSGRALRNGLFQAIGVLLLVVLLARVEFRGGLERLFSLVRSGVNAPLILLLLWAAVGTLRAPDRAFAIGELLRLASGAVIYFAVALHVQARTQLCLLLDCLVGTVILVCGYGLVWQGSEVTRAIRVSSVFPHPMQLGAVLAALLPLLTSLALGLEDRGRRIAAITAAVLCGMALLVCLERSAWIAAGVGLLGWLLLRSGTTPAASFRRSWRAAMAIAATGLLVGIGFFSSTRDVDAVIADRAGQISDAVRGQDTSFAWRVHKWRIAAAMAGRRPLWGYGPGQYVLHAYSLSHLGSPPEEIRRYGASFDDMAFNEYLQTAAELGFPGLALYLLILASFFSKGYRALQRLPEGLRKTTLLGCMAGIMAQMVDAMANGSWRYTECSNFFWLVLGLGIAVIRMAYQAPATRAAEEQRLAVGARG